jgi:archaellum component FlaF (FlaF/FlaG flagellin family)
MGFGTSGSALLIFAALFLAVSSLYTASTNATERVRDAQAAQTDHRQTIRVTDIDVTNATYNTTSGNFTLTVTNTGESTLSPDFVDAVVDGNYLDGSEFEQVTVDGRETPVWRPGETVTLVDSDSVTSAPGRVKFVSGPGVADTAPVGVTS